MIEILYSINFYVTIISLKHQLNQKLFGHLNYVDKYNLSNNTGIVIKVFK